MTSTTRINEPKLRRDIRDERAIDQLRTMAEDWIQAVIDSPLKPHEKRSLLHDVIDGCKEANRNDITGWRSTMKITEAQLRKGIRKIIREQWGPVNQDGYPGGRDSDQPDFLKTGRVDQLDGDAYQQGFEDGEAGVGPADSNDGSYMMGWNAGTDNASGGYDW